MELLAPQATGAEAGQANARRALREQIDRLEEATSRIVAARFPHLPARLRSTPAAEGPALLDLASLERQRDALAAQLSELEELGRRRDELERSSRERLEEIRRNPGRYRFARIPVRDLGEGGCGVWHVRPRLGIIGMLAGWWELKLSSGCPLAMGSRTVRGPAPTG